MTLTDKGLYVSLKILRTVTTTSRQAVQRSMSGVTLKTVDTCLGGTATINVTVWNKSCEAQIY